MNGLLSAYLCNAVFMLILLTLDWDELWFCLLLLLKTDSLQDEEEEIYLDIEEDVSDDSIAEEKLVDTDKDEKIQSVKQCQMKPTASWVHHQNLEGEPHFYAIIIIINIFLQYLCLNVDKGMSPTF